MVLEGNGDVEWAGPGSGEVWMMVFRLFGLMRAHLERVCGEFGMSSVQGRALLALEPGDPRAMGRLAERLGNDASNITTIVDQLEELGLVERRTAERDRRIKTLVVTGKGKELRGRLVSRLKEAPSPITRLPREDQRVLHELLRRVVGEQ
ncbi:MAG: MarR family winged helix-turn-helix transcriptional regulator [Rubrobacteraceae bacterium]